MVEEIIRSCADRTRPSRKGRWFQSTGKKIKLSGKERNVCGKDSRRGIRRGSKRQSRGVEDHKPVAESLQRAEQAFRSNALLVQIAPNACIQSGAQRSRAACAGQYQQHANGMHGQLPTQTASSACTDAHTLSIQRSDTGLSGKPGKEAGRFPGGGRRGGRGEERDSAGLVQVEQPGAQGKGGSGHPVGDPDESVNPAQPVRDSLGVEIEELTDFVVFPSQCHITQNGLIL